MSSPKQPMALAGQRRALLLGALVAVACPLALRAQAAPARIGVLLMHGKGGSPNRHVNELAAALASQGMLVANQEMPWSGRRNYDVSADTAEREIEATLASLRAKGAEKILLAGHSQGGLFALYFASRHAAALDGVIAIAPGGDPNSAVPREKLAAAVQTARELVEQGWGNEQARFADFENSKGVTPLYCTAANYLSWFDPDTGPGMLASAKALPASVPVLYVAPTNDYPFLARTSKAVFASLPPNPLTQLYQPEASHMAAPQASIAKVLEWSRAVADAQ